MKSLKIYGLILMITGIFACAEDNHVGDIPELTAEYVLPQGHSSADTRIVEIFENWGTYILYEYSEADLQWLQVEVNNMWNGYEFTAPDTLYVDEMMDFLEKAWFQFFPNEFHQKFMPYKVFLASELKYVDSYYGTETEYSVRIVGSHMIIAHCSDELANMTNEEKIMFKQNIQDALWTSWLNELDIPDEFYEVSNYSVIASANPEDWNYARGLGFIADEDGVEWSTQDPWPSTALSEYADLDTFVSGMCNRTSEEWEEDLAYPLVKQKYDILRDYFLDSHAFDIQAIGNMTEF